MTRATILDRYMSKLTVYNHAIVLGANLPGSIVRPGNRSVLQPVVGVRHGVVPLAVRTTSGARITIY